MRSSTVYIVWSETNPEITDIFKTLKDAGKRQRDIRFKDPRIDVQIKEYVFDYTKGDIIHLGQTMAELAMGGRK